MTFGGVTAPVPEAPPVPAASGDEVVCSTGARSLEGGNDEGKDEGKDGPPPAPAAPSGNMSDGSAAPAPAAPPQPNTMAAVAATIAMPIGKSKAPRRGRCRRNILYFVFPSSPSPRGLTIGPE